MRRLRSSALACMPVGLFAVAVAVRLAQHHTALLYPDGYQYLLMARGIGEHLQPTTVLGPGGDEFIPSADAGVKPLFPLLVAAVHAVGASWLDAARFVTVAAGALAVTALALLVTKLTGSRLAGLAAGVLLLASPSVAFWSGFSGPDPLAQALVLTAALGFAHRRPRLGGAVTGLAIAARPEIAVVAIAAAVMSLRDPQARNQVRRAGPAAVITAALVYALLRTPVTVSDWRLVGMLPALLIVLGLLMFVPTRWLRTAGLASLGATALVIASRPGPATVWDDDWPLVVVGAAGLFVLLLHRERSVMAAVVMGVVYALGAVYLLKNPTLGRYFALLLPAAALLAGIAVGTLPVRFRALGTGVAAAAAAFGLLHPIPGSRDYDMFPTVAERIAGHLEPREAPLITAAPDAYGFWLPERAVLRMRPGARGSILLDATQRLYEPDLGASGSVVARVVDGVAFTRPDLELDARPAVLVAGEVVFTGHATR